MPELKWNEAIWNGSYDWSTAGEEWSTGWGGSEAQWFGSLYPRLHRWLPCINIAEIAPGFGRWTKFLIPMCRHYAGIDMSDQCINSCRTKFGQIEDRSFFQNNGKSLDMISDNHWDLVFSFDSLVHVELDIMEEYIPQTIKKLRLGGVAFIHHSNLFACEAQVQNEHNRATSVSAQLVRSTV